MSEKYIDLADAIKGDRGWTRAAIESILEWLDEHADQAPGRTITESEFQKLMEDVTTSYQVGFTDGLYMAGGRVVPDPEPTNVEKLATHIGDIAGMPYTGLSASEVDRIAAELDRRGVKAPEAGDDDEQ